MKIIYSAKASKSIRDLFYYPYTFGNHLKEATKDRNEWQQEIFRNTKSLGIHRVLVPNIGTFLCYSDGNQIYVNTIVWNKDKKAFYYTKKNFHTFVCRGNTLSVHPSKYVVRDEEFFKCDNGFKVISRKVRNKEWFNFINLNGVIISEIDFSEVIPFDKDKNMMARGYTYNGSCYIVDELGNRTEINETRNCYIGLRDYITEQKYINTTYKMKSLQEYISEQMVCELSSVLLKRAANKAKGSRKKEFEQAASKAEEREHNPDRYEPILREKLPEIDKLMNKGFYFRKDYINDLDFENGDSDWLLVQFFYDKTPDLIFSVWLDEFEFASFEIYKESVSDQDPIVEHNFKTKYYKTLQDRREVKAIVDFADAFGVKIDKNELIA